MEGGTALRGPEHVKKGTLRHGGPSELAAPVIVEDAEFGPCPAKLVKGLRETADGASAVRRLDFLAQGFYAGAQLVVAINLSAHRWKCLAQRNGIELEGVA